MLLFDFKNGLCYIHRGDIMNSCWNNFFNKEICDELAKIFKQIGDNYYPYKGSVLRFTNLDLSKIKYVILGMDPYASSYLENNKKIPTATGRSFEVSNLENWNSNFRQSSLKNIVKTIYFNETGKINSWKLIKEDINSKKFSIKKPKEWFDSLENQGIMFLNSALTVEPNNPGSHINIWKNFMNELITYINDYNNEIKWIVWGKESYDRISTIIEDERIIKGVHPRNYKFVEENSLKKVKGINFLG